VANINDMSHKQITDTILMVRPANFGFNVQTAESNAFQTSETALEPHEIQTLALQEFDQFVEILRRSKIRVIIIQDTGEPTKYDAIFPNNWISTHQDGTIITYPMYAPMRRLERRDDIIEDLKKEFQTSSIIHLENYEIEDIYLEGTGSLILDRPNRLAYACKSVRTNEKILDDFCYRAGFEKIIFTATDSEDLEIYHTNVMMALGEDFVVICLDTIKDEAERNMLIQKFEATNKVIIEISLEQMLAFAGNMLQVKNKDEDTFLIMSEQAYRSLTTTQKEQIERYTDILYSPLYTIEKFGGGSARCMLAEIYLPK